MIKKVMDNMLHNAVDIISAVLFLVIAAIPSGIGKQAIRYLGEDKSHVAPIENTKYAIKKALYAG